jgi:hypothetical protein
MVGRQNHKPWGQKTRVSPFTHHRRKMQFFRPLQLEELSSPYPLQKEMSCLGPAGIRERRRSGEKDEHATPKKGLATHVAVRVYRGSIILVNPCAKGAGEPELGRPVWASCKNPPRKQSRLQHCANGVAKSNLLLRCTLQRCVPRRRRAPSNPPSATRRHTGNTTRKY